MQDILRIGDAKHSGGITAASKNGSDFQEKKKTVKKSCLLFLADDCLLWEDICSTAEIRCDLEEISL